MQASAVLVLVLACLKFQDVWSSHVWLSSDYRFQDLLLTAQSEDFYTVDNLIKLNATLNRFSEALAFAAEAAGRRISLETVRLLIPPDKVDELRAAGFPVVPQTWESEANADIRLTASDDTNMTVVPNDECGMESRYIQVPSHLIRNKGEPRTLLAAFGQYRWGLLSEKNADKLFFYDSGKWQPNICSLAVPGTYTRDGCPASSSIDCCYDESTDGGEFTVHPSCAFFPSNLGDYASLLYYSMRLFCNSSANTPASHNPRADNNHNRMCQGKSAVEVMRAHTDFSVATAGSPTSATAPTLLLVQPNGVRKVVLVLDVSGSMGGIRIASLIRAAILYVKYFLETGAEVAIVSFSNVVELKQGLTKVTDQAAREALATVIKGLVADGGTNIADAINFAMQLLGATAPYSKSQTGFVVLISDGEHNAASSLDEAVANAAKTSIVFDTLCISNSAEPRLAQLASVTGGMKLFSSASSGATTELESGFTKLADRVPSSSSSNKFKLLRASTISLPSASQSVEIDASITSSLHFMISMSGVDLATINFTVVSPNENVYGSFMGPDVYEVITAISTITIKIPDAAIEPGTWVLHIESVSSAGRRKRSAQRSNYESHRRISRFKRSTGTGTVVVVGGTGGNASISIDAWLRYSSFSKVTEASVQKIYAYCLLGSAPLTNATVQAVVVPGLGVSFVVPLKDDGLGSDLTANDGIYVGQILPERLTSLGDYSVTIVMTSPASRVATAGAFRVEALATGSVILPPGKVTGFTVAMSVKNQYVRVGFISPGNQGYEGIAAGYEIRASNSFDQVSQVMFYTAPLVARLSSGQPVGTNVEVVLWASNFTGVDTNATFYLAVAAMSTSGLRGDSSFPLGASLSYPAGYTPPISYAVTTAGAVTSHPAPNSSTTSTTGASTPAVAVTNSTDQASEPVIEWSPGMMAAVGAGTAAILAEIVGIVVVVKVL